MRGDIWKMPADGGEAIAITSGPGVSLRAGVESGRHAASRSRIEATGNLDIGIVSANGGPVETIASHPRVDIQPAWSRDGKILFFVSARAGGFRIFRHDFATNTDTPVTNGIQPAVSPDGKLLAYEQSGLRVLDLATGESRMVRDEETEYRMEPSWTPDGQNILYVTEDEGSNDIRIVPAAGGDAIELTTDTTRHEMSPAVSPDGTRFAFVQFDAGVPDALHGRDHRRARERVAEGADHDAPQPSRRPAASAFACVGPDGQPVGARIYIDASDGRHYTPDDAFHRSMMVFDRHYFHMTADAEVEVPAGRTTHRGHSRLAVRAEGRDGRRAGRRRADRDDPPRAAGRSAGARLVLGRQSRARSASGLRPDARGVLPAARRGRSQRHARADSHGRHAADGPLERPHRQAESAVDADAHSSVRAGVPRRPRPHRHDRRARVHPAVRRPAPAARRTRSRRSRTSISKARARRAASPASCIRISRRRARPRTRRRRSSRVDLALGLGDYYDIGALWSDELGLGGFLLPAAQRRLPHAGHGRHGQLLGRVSRSAAGIGSHVRASDRAADASELDRRRSSAAARSSRPDRCCCCRSTAASPARRSRCRRRRRRRCA